MDSVDRSQVESPDKQSLLASFLRIMARILARIILLSFWIKYGI
jgi:hypothetical protein